MTPEQKAELRRLAEAVPQPIEGPIGLIKPTEVAFLRTACNAIPELLDELEACQKNADWQRRNVNGVVSQVERERDSLTALVVRLREALEMTLREYKGCTPSHPEYKGPTAKYVLANTEDAATTWLEADRREQRLAGARAYLHWNAGDQPGFIERMMEAFRADLEREA